MFSRRNILTWLSVLTAAAGTTAADAAAADLTSRASDRSHVGLTIYNNDLSLIREHRSVTLDEGMFTLDFADVTSQIHPATVHLSAISGSVRILEQNYEFDLISRDKLMEKYVGREVAYRTEDGTLGTAKLLSTNGGYVYELGSKIVFELPGSIVLDAIPSELTARPTLKWFLEADAGGKRDIEVTYLTGGLSWKADYIFSLDEAETKGDLVGWVTINNTSGAAFENAELQLVAGDVNRVRDDMRRMQAQAMHVAPKNGRPEFEEESLFEYHLYSLQRPTTLKDHQQKQVLFFDASDVAVEKRYTFRGGYHHYNRNYRVASNNEKVSVELRFKNSEDNNLGVPVPMGTVRVYKDSDGKSQFLGENRVDHTPKDEWIDFEVGKAFDIIGERTQRAWRQVAEGVQEISVEVTLRNHKEEAVQVRVLEPMYGDWEITSSTLEHKKPDATTAEFLVDLDADEEESFTYTVRIKR